MQFNDAVVLDGVRRTRDGYLVADAKIARTGIQTYHAGEIGLTDRNPADVVRVYRPDAEVFAQDAMASLAHRPMTVDHPAELVTADNWKKHAVGLTGGDIARDGDFIRVPLTLMDSAAIADFEAGRRELSVGYTCDLVMEAGTTPSGEAYDAVQRSIRGNHVALCRTARGGPELRLGDIQPNPQGGPTVALKTIIVDGLPVETTDAGEAAVNLLRSRLADSVRAMDTAAAAHTTAIAAKDADLGKKDAEIADLKTKVIDGAALDALVAERSAVLARAKVIAPTLDATGKSNAEIRRAAVAAKLGDAAVKDKSDDYVGALFDHTTSDAKTPDPLHQVLGDGVQVTDAAKARDDALAARNARYSTGYQAAAE